MQNVSDDVYEIATTAVGHTRDSASFVALSESMKMIRNKAGLQRGKK